MVNDNFSNNFLSTNPVIIDSQKYQNKFNNYRRKRSMNSRNYNKNENLKVLNP